MINNLNEKIKAEILELNDNNINNDGFDLSIIKKITLVISNENSCFLSVNEGLFLDEISNNIDEINDTRGLVKLSSEDINFIKRNFVVCGVSVRYSEHDDDGVFKWACKDFVMENISSLSLPVSPDFSDKSVKIRKCFFDSTFIFMKILQLPK